MGADNHTDEQHVSWPLQIWNSCMHTLRNWGPGDLGGFQFCVDAVHHSCSGMHLSIGVKDRHSEHEISSISISASSAVFRAPEFADSLGLSQSCSISCSPLELESPPLLLVTARPLTQAGRPVPLDDVVSTGRAHRRKGKTSPCPAAADWSVVCGWSTRSAAGLAVRAARRSSAVTTVVR